MAKASSKAKAVTTQPERRPVGRPTDYRPEYCARVVQLGKEGKSRAQIASALDTTRVTLLAWERTNPEFLAAMTRATDEALAWWEEQGRCGLAMGSAFNAALYGKCMAGRFPNEPYRNQIALTGADGGALQIEDRRQIDPSMLPPDQRLLFATLLRQALAKPVEQIEGEFRAEEDEG